MLNPNPDSAFLRNVTKALVSEQKGKQAVPFNGAPSRTDGEELVTWK